jgi:hypothetical protein
MDGDDEYHSGAGAGGDSDGEADGRGDDAEGDDGAGADAAGDGDGDGDGEDGGGASSSSSSSAHYPSSLRKRCPVCTTTYEGDRAMFDYRRHLRHSECRLSDDSPVWTAERLSELRATLERLGHEALRDEGGVWTIRWKGGVAPPRRKRRKK